MQAPAGGSAHGPAPAAADALGSFASLGGLARQLAAAPAQLMPGAPASADREGAEISVGIAPEAEAALPLSVPLLAAEAHPLSRSAPQQVRARRRNSGGGGLRQSSLSTGFALSPSHEGYWQDLRRGSSGASALGGAADALEKATSTLSNVSSLGDHGFQDAGGQLPGGGAAVSELPSGPAGKQPRTPPAPAPRPAMELLIGLVNAIITLPVMTAFTTIIFTDRAFDAVIGQLVKLVFFSSALHQAVFTARSTLPFAVGQVQDVGLIFLSAMASSVCELTRAAGLAPAVLVATVLATLTAATLLVGLAIIATGRFRLAGLVQYVPLPVVGGYLGYVGYFCLVSGISLATGVRVAGDSPASWLGLGQADALRKLAAAAGSTALLMVAMARLRSPWALPAVLTVIPAVFYAVLFATHHTRADAQAGGWIAKPQAGEGSGHFWDVWKLYAVDDFGLAGIYWGAMPRQLPTALALYFVVAFGSSMDVAAIQQDVPWRLDYNRELVTVGISNVATALAGAGFTGSYIFSQTIFSLRSGISTRLNGLVIIIVELACFVLPFSILEYLPNFFFGALMIWIGIEISKDWLILAYWRVTHAEYALLWATFAAILAFGLELGIAAGVGAAAALFAFSYARVMVTAFSVVPSRSDAVRTFEQRTVLESFSSRMVAVALSGYIFFGSSVTISEKVLQVAQAALLQPPPAAVAIPDELGAYEALPVPSAPPPSGRAPPKMPRIESATTVYEGSVKGRAAAAIAAAPRFLLLDFRRVMGLDATAARTFGTLRASLDQMGIELILTHLPASRPQIRELLIAHGVACEADTAGAPCDSSHLCRCFPSMEAGLHYCEETFLELAVRHGLCRPVGSSMSLGEVLRAHLALPAALLPAPINYAKAAGELRPFMTELRLEAGQRLFSAGDASDAIYIILRGTVHVQVRFLRLGQQTQLAGLPPALAAEAETGGGARLLVYGPGGILGELDFFLQRQRSFAATTQQPAHLLCLSRAAFERMAVAAPHLLCLLQTIILRSTSLSASHALEALERAGTS